ncbi:MAG TPA: hypothetical protein VGS97_15940 [Actinocrinis sp.]|uniref:hypothetical protein n=1 Tax=Actinocrinis sp. TaxID=1920516 RepID=UPI002DDDB9D1|nr:hypothetical protein [Actinocrinis sp.]HEV2345590.1 hypothetical protein [Actinocrinis sp.]
MDVSATSDTEDKPFSTAPPTGEQAAPSLEDTVSSAESALAEAQIALEAARLDLDRLTRLHHHHLGPLYDRLDELDLLIAEAKAVVSGDPEQARRAYELRYGSAGAPVFDPLTDPLPPEPEPAPLIDPEYASTLRFIDSAEPAEDQSKTADPAKTLQRLYRDLARRAHPDFTQDPREKERRNAFITRVNDAYRRADLYDLQRLAEEWTVISANGPEAGTEERQLWLRQRLIWLRARTAEARVERDTLLSSPLGQVLAEFGAERALDALSARLFEQIQYKEDELRAMYATETVVPVQHQTPIEYTAQQQISDQFHVPEQKQVAQEPYPVWALPEPEKPDLGYLS